MRGEREWEEERENGKGKKKEIKKFDVWVLWLVVGIEERYRGWMAAGELDIEKRICLTMTEYSI